MEDAPSLQIDYVPNMSEVCLRYNVREQDVEAIHKRPDELAFTVIRDAHGTRKHYWLPHEHWEKHGLFSLDYTIKRGVPFEFTPLRVGGGFLIQEAHGFFEELLKVYPSIRVRCTWNEFTTVTVDDKSSKLDLVDGAFQLVEPPAT